VHQALLADGVRHEVVRLPSSAGSAEDLPRLLGVDRSECVTVHCYRVSGARTPDGAVVHLAVLLVRSGDVPDDARVRAALDAGSVRRATPDEVSAHTDQAASLVCPVGLPEDVAVLADARLARPDAGGSDVRWCATGESGTALGLRLRDLLVRTGARVGALTREAAVTALPDPVSEGSWPDWRSGGAQVIPLDTALAACASAATRSAG
jgi:Cys-tRNA(Pro)/Cys-tRNA(Cys) deacylase